MKSEVRSLKSALAASIVLVAACSRSPAPNPTTPQTPAQTDAGRAGRASAPIARCRDLPSASDLKEYLRRAPGEGGDAGGLFSGKMEWASIVNRSGEICATAVATEDPATAWPGAQALAKAKAYTANAFSTDTFPMSTARLYTMSQSGHSLFGAAGANAFDPACFETPQTPARSDGKICGGAVFVGGGVPLYKGKIRIGGLGVSGDTPCADHEIAKRIRRIAQLDPERGALADDISYSSVEGASVFSHPLCPNTWLNGKRIGDEPKASGY